MDKYFNFSQTNSGQYLPAAGDPRKMSFPVGGPQSQASLFSRAPEDVHICGSCRGQFLDIEQFVQHKRHECPARLFPVQTSQPHPTHHVPGPGPLGPSHGGPLQFHHPQDPTVQLQQRDDPNSHMQRAGVSVAQMQAAQHHTAAMQQNADPMGQAQQSQHHATHMQQQQQQQQQQTHHVTHSQPSQLNQSHMQATHTSLAVGGQTQSFQPWSDPKNSAAAFQRSMEADGQSEVEQLFSEAVNSQADGSEMATMAALTSQLSPPAESETPPTSQGEVPGEAIPITTAPTSIRNITPISRPEDIHAKSLETKAGGATVVRNPNPVACLKPKSSLTKPFICTVDGCTFMSQYQKDLDRHVRIHTGEKPFSCCVCNKSFNRADKLKIHMRSHTGLKPYKCNLCDYKAADSSSLKKHARIHTDERPFKCQICPYASRNSSQLIVHLRTHTGDAPFQCSQCTAKFKINSDLKRHMRLHTGEKPYQCPLCSYRCAIKGNLNTHMRINHSSDTMRKCDKCEFATSSRKVLSEHKKTHGGDGKSKTFSCQVCSYVCLSRTTLKSHMRTHSNEKPFACPHCDYTSKQSGNVRTHIRRRHPNMVKFMKTLKSKKNPLEEDVGPERQIDQSAVIPIEILPREISPKGIVKPICKKRYSCNVCDASFVRLDSLRSHVRQHTEREKEMVQVLESTALAVLQLHNPFNLPTSSTGVTQSESNVVVSQVSSQTQAEVLPSAPNSITVTSSNTFNNVLKVGESAVAGTPTTTSQAAVTQAANNLMAFMQNNQNKAVEDNIHNAAISASRQEAQRAAQNVNGGQNEGIRISHQPLSRQQLDEMKSSLFQTPVQGSNLNQRQQNQVQGQTNMPSKQTTTMMSVMVPIVIEPGMGDGNTVGSASGQFPSLVVSSGGIQGQGSSTPHQFVLQLPVQASSCNMGDGTPQLQAMPIPVRLVQNASQSVAPSGGLTEQQMPVTTETCDMATPTTSSINIPSSLKEAAVVVTESNPPGGEGELSLPVVTESSTVDITQIQVPDPDQTDLTDGSSRKQAKLPDSGSQ